MIHLYIESLIHFDIYSINCMNSSSQVFVNEKRVC